MSLLPGGKLRSYRNGQVIFAKDWENEFKNLMRAYNVGQASWFGINFFPGAPTLCAQGDLTHLFPPAPTGLPDIVYKIEGIYASYGLAGTSCDVYTMRVNGVAVADLLVPDGVPPTDRTIDVNNQIGSVKVCAGLCCTTFVTDNDSQTQYIWKTPLDPGDVPQIGDEVTFTIGAQFADASCAACSSLFAVYVNGIPSGLSVCIPPNANPGDIFLNNQEIIINPDDQITIVPEKVGPHQDITVQIFGCRAPALVSVVLEPILTKFYFYPGDPIDFSVGDASLTLTEPMGLDTAGRYVQPLAAGTDAQFLGKIYQFPSDCFLDGHPDNTFQTTLKIQLAGYTTIGNIAIGSHSIKVKLQLVSAVGDPYNPDPGDVKLTLISDASALFTNSMGTCTPITGPFAAKVSKLIGGNVIEPTAVTAGDMLVLSMYITLAADSDINYFTGDTTTTVNGDVIEYIDSMDNEHGPWSQSYIELGVVFP